LPPFKEPLIVGRLHKAGYRWHTGILAYGLTGLGFLLLARETFFWAFVGSQYYLLLLPLYFVLWIFTSIVLTWFAEIHWRKR